MIQVACFPPQSCVPGEVEGCQSHHFTSVPGRMDVSMWRGVSVKGADSQTVPERASSAQHRSTCCSFLSGPAQFGWSKAERVCVCEEAALMR